MIGASKAGTSSLHHYLAQHPDVSMSWPKEPNFFTREDYEGRAGLVCELLSGRARSPW